MTWMTTPFFLVPAAITYYVTEDVTKAVLIPLGATYALSYISA